MNWAKIGLFAAGVLFGTAGIKVLSSKDAKKVYTETTAAALRAKECVMTTVTTIKENERFAGFCIFCNAHEVFIEVYST